MCLLIITYALLELDRQSLKLTNMLPENSSLLIYSLRELGVHSFRVAAFIDVLKCTRNGTKKQHQPRRPKARQRHPHLVYVSEIITYVNEENVKEREPYGTVLAQAVVRINGVALVSVLRPMNVVQLYIEQNKQSISYVANMEPELNA